MCTHTFKHVSALYKAAAIGLLVAHTIASAKTASATRPPLDQLAARLR